MQPQDYLAAVEAGFRASAAGRAYAPAPMHISAEEGGFHAKGASFRAERGFVALKLNGNFPLIANAMACRRSRVRFFSVMRAMARCLRSWIPAR